MAVPLIQQYRVARYIMRKKLARQARYPLVLMLEPLFQCNLACAGCGKIDQPKDILKQRMSVEDALNAVDECSAPIVSIPGGEPLIHKDMPEIVKGIIARRKFVYLCTNVILMKKKDGRVRPVALFHLVGASGRPESPPRRIGVPGRCIRQSHHRDRNGARPGIPGDHQLHPVQR